MSVLRVQSYESMPYFRDEPTGKLIEVLQMCDTGELYFKGYQLENAGYIPKGHLEWHEGVISYRTDIFQEVYDFLIPIGRMKDLYDYPFSNLPYTHPANRNEFSVENNWGMNLIKPSEKRKYNTYFLLAPLASMLKIGKATNIASRIKSVQTGSPEILQLIGSVEEDIEFELHKQFAHLRSHGEWFKYTPELQDMVSKLTSTTWITRPARRKKP